MTGSIVVPTVVNENTSIESSVDPVPLINVTVAAKVVEKYNLSCLRKRSTEKMMRFSARNVQCFCPS